MRYCLRKCGTYFCHLLHGECAYLDSSHTQSLVLYVLHRSTYALVFSSPNSQEWMQKRPREGTSATSCRRTAILEEAKWNVGWCICLSWVCMQMFESNGSKLALAYVKNVKCCAKCGKCRAHVLVTRRCIIHYRGKSSQIGCLALHCGKTSSGSTARL